VYFKDPVPEGGKGNKAKSEAKKQFKVLLQDLYVAWLDDPELSISLGMSNNPYKQTARYNALFISAKIIEVVNQAYNAGLADKLTSTEGARKEILPMRLDIAKQGWLLTGGLSDREA